MPTTIQCPHCEKRLKIQEASLGKQVRCPACKEVFKAAELPPEPTEEEVEEGIQKEEAPERRPVRRPRRQEVEDDEEEEEEEDEEEEEERPRRRRRRRRIGRGRPHRAGAVLTMGILTILFGFCCPLVCWIVGSIGLRMANSDLNAMDAGDMDRSGRGTTQTGKTLMTIGLVISFINALLGIVLRLSGALK